MPIARPLTEKARRFAELYAGDGVAAARGAGYKGEPDSLKVTASRLLDDDRVQAVLTERRKAAGVLDGEPEPEPDLSMPEPPPAFRRVNVRDAESEAKEQGVSPAKILAEIATDPTVHPSSRVAAAKALDQHQRETHQTTADPHTELRSKVTQIVLERRAREREERER